MNINLSVVLNYNIVSSSKIRKRHFNFILLVLLSVTLFIYVSHLSFTITFLFSI